MGSCMVAWVSNCKPSHKLCPTKYARKGCSHIKCNFDNITAFSKQIQTGSRSQMLSPLFINTNSTPEAETILPAQTYCEVSIIQINRSFNLVRQFVLLTILKRILIIYSVILPSFSQFIWVLRNNFFSISRNSKGHTLGVASDEQWATRLRNGQLGCGLFKIETLALAHRQV